MGINFPRLLVSGLLNINPRQQKQREGCTLKKWKKKQKLTTSVSLSLLSLLPVFPPSFFFFKEPLPGLIYVGLIYLPSPQHSTCPLRSWSPVPLSLSWLLFSLSEGPRVSFSTLQLPCGANHSSVSGNNLLYVRWWRLPKGNCAVQMLSFQHFCILPMVYNGEAA